MSKTLNYLNSSLIFPWFTIFIGIWVYLRHYINLVVIYATLTDFRSVGPFELDWDTQQYKCWISQYITFALLASLQSINLFWLFFIIRIAYNIVFAKVVADVRSDDEDSEVEIDEKQSEGYEVGISGGEKKALDGPKMNGIKIANGKASEPHDSYADAVKEGKKER
jgi:acyl-CoA-dependent ceramide synthase